MAGNVMNKALIFLLSPLLLGLAACGGGQQAEQGALAGARIGGPFTLTDQDGRKRSWDSFRGQYRLVYFGYTYCPDVCPVDLQHIMQAFARFEKQSPALAAKVQPIFITLDPERDAPPVLKTYVAAFHPRLIGLTGTPDEIAKVARDFVVIYGKADEKGPKDYLVSHSRTPYLFGPDGAPIALVPVDDPGTADKDEGGPDAVLAALDHWVK
ncbi:MAG: SCO family protein [Sphingobium sp.]|nr:MAG: SCO family protein [Sphingobium sp.]